MDLQVSIPYGGNQQMDCDIVVFDNRAGERAGTLNWNGLTASVNVPDVPQGRIVDVKRFNERSNLPMELVRDTGFVPLRRGFSKPFSRFVQRDAGVVLGRRSRVFARGRTMNDSASMR